MTTGSILLLRIQQFKTQQLRWFRWKLGFNNNLNGKTEKEDDCIPQKQALQNGTKIALKNDLNAFSFKSYEDTYLNLPDRLNSSVSNYVVLRVHVSLKHTCDSVVLF